jgi:hypothetical protein
MVAIKDGIENDPIGLRASVVIALEDIARVRWRAMSSKAA